MNIPAYISSQVAAIDRYTIEECGVDILQLMEVAGMRSAEAALKLFGETKNIAVLAGPGGNGGDALVCAKWLKLWGCNPTVILSHPEEKLKPITKHQLNIWNKFATINNQPSTINIQHSTTNKELIVDSDPALAGESVDCRWSEGVYDRPSGPVDGIIDGLLGYSLEGDPRGKSADLIRWANETQSPILALDIPSGLDATTGEVHDPCIKAAHTVVFGVMKVGLTVEDASDFAGEIELVDIGFPREFPKNILES